MAVKIPAKPAAVKAPIRPAIPAKPAPSADAKTRELAKLTPPVAAPSVTGFPVKRGPGRPTNAEIAARNAGATIPAPPRPGMPPFNTAPGGQFTRVPVAPTPPFNTAPGGQFTRVPVAPTPPVDVAALYAQINAMGVQIESLTKKAAKAESVNVRTVEEILTGGETGLPADDWRLAYQGAEIKTAQFGFAKGNEAIELKAGPPLSVMLAIPRSADVGKRGTASRSASLLAVHWARNEDGAFEGEPSYVTSDELAAIWLD